MEENIPEGAAGAVIGKTYQEAKVIRDKFIARFFDPSSNNFDSPIHGVGVGISKTRRGSTRFIISVYVSEDFREKGNFPKRSFNGVPLRYEVTGLIIPAQVV